MRLRIRMTALLCAVLLLFLNGCAPALQKSQMAPSWLALESVEKERAVRTPAPREDGTPYRVLMVAISFDATVSVADCYLRGLKQTGWILENPLEDGQAVQYDGLFDGCELGPYLEVCGEKIYDIAADGQQAVSQAVQAYVDAGEADIIVTLGTEAAQLGKLHARDRVPVLAFPLADAVGSGIVKGEQYSGIPNVWAYTDPERYQRQLVLYHDLIPFKKLGLIYYDEGLGGRTGYREAAAQIGIELVERRIDPPPVSDGVDDETALASYWAGLEAACDELLEQEGIDAFMLTTQLIQPQQRAQAFIQRFHEAGVPVFIQTGEPLVEAGGLIMQESLVDEEVGQLVADVTVRVLCGEQPGDIMQPYTCTPYIVVNQQAARALNIQLPFELLISSEKIY